MSEKHYLIGGNTRQQARDMAMGALRASQMPMNEQTQSPNTPPGQTKPKTGGTPEIWGIVRKDIGKPDSVDGFPSNAGRVEIYGQHYPDTDDNGDPIEPEYDYCTCYELAESEVLMEGDWVQLTGPKSVPKPDEEPPDDDEESDDEESENVSLYAAINTLGEYTSQLKSDLTFGETSTIDVKINEETREFTVHCLKLTDNQKLTAGMGITVSRSISNSERILEVMLGPCPLEE